MDQLWIRTFSTSSTQSQGTKVKMEKGRGPMDRKRSKVTPVGMVDGKVC